MSNAAAERELRMAAVMCHTDKSKEQIQNICHDLTNVIQVTHERVTVGHLDR